MEPLIQVENLSKSFGAVRAVDDLSFSVNPGEVYGFLGQNGAGKSTTLRMLLTLIRPDSGSIRIFGRNLQHSRKEVLREIGAVIERPDLYPYLTGMENLRLFARISGKPCTVDRMNGQLETVGLAERAGSKVSTYSQGMKQRLGLAIALVHNPKLLILDEPSNGLDPQGIADIRNLILRLSRKEGKTILVSSHLLSEIQLMADRMLIIDKGRKMAEGSVAELMDPSNMLLALDVLQPQRVYDLLQQGPWRTSLKEFRNGQILLQLPRQQIPEFNRYLVKEEIDLLGLQARYSLEEYFLSLTTANQHVEHFED